MKKIIQFQRTQSTSVKQNSVTIRHTETRVISIKSKNGMTEKEAYQKIISLYKKEY